MKVTLKQIAEIAGVHRSTVDKVLHNRDGVSDEVRQKIKKIIAELGYKPNIIGKALACQNKPLIIAVVLLKVDAVEEIKAGIEKAYSEYKNFGLIIQYYPISNVDELEQVNIINLLKKKRVSGLIISPVDNNNIKNAINQIVDIGIPVVTVNSDIPESKRMCFIGQDMKCAGRVAGELMGEILNGSGNVALITGSNSLLSSIERQKGFEEVISEKFSDIKIIKTIQTYEQRIATFQKTLSLLQSEDNLNGIYITCGSVSEVGKAVRLMNKQKEIKIISFDLYPEIVELVKEGVINFTIGQNLFDQGFKSLKILFEHLFFGNDPETKHIRTSIDIRLKENISID